MVLQLHRRIDIDGSYISTRSLALYKSGRVKKRSLAFPPAESTYHLLLIIRWRCWLYAGGICQTYCLGTHTYMHIQCVGAVCLAGLPTPT